MTSKAVISPLAFEDEMRNVTRTLSRDAGLTVEIGGTEAYAKGGRIVLPQIDRTQDISPYQANVARGYVDHESVRYRETDPEWVEKAEDHSKFAKAMVTSVEDVRTEALQISRYPGSRHNLAAVADATAKLAVEKLDGGEFDLSNKLALLPLCTEMAGRQQMDFNIDDEAIKRLKEHAGDKLWAAAEGIARQARKLAKTEDAYELGMRVVLNPPDPDDPPPPEGQGDGGDQDDDCTGDGGNGHGKGKSGGSGQQPSAGDNPDQQEDDGDGKDDADSGADSGGDDEEEDDADNGGGGDGQGGDQEDAQPQQPQSGASNGAGGAPINPVQVNGSDAVNRMFAPPQVTGEVPYLADWNKDKIVTVKTVPGTLGPSGVDWFDYRVRANDPEGHERYRAIKRDIGSHLNAIKSAFERYLMTQINRGWMGGLPDGNIDPRRLASAVAGAENVFRKKDERNEIDTAVSILVDLSGSMSGSRIAMATKACIAVSEALQKCGVPFEIVGHSTGHMLHYRQDGTDPFADNLTRKDVDACPPGEGVRTYGDPVIVPYGASASKAVFAERSDGSLEMVSNYYDADKYSLIRQTRGAAQLFYVFKGFNESLFQCEGPIAGMIYLAKGATTEGDGVLKAYQRLMRRNERRKVLIVLSDGAPGCVGMADESTHLANVCAKLEQDPNLYLMQIGIQSNAGKAFYRNCFVIQKIEELPRVLFAQMKKALFVKRAA